MKRFTKIILLGVICGFLMGSFVSSARADYRYVRLSSKDQLEVDFDKNGRYEPFFVKGVVYSPYDIGTLPTPAGVGRYVGEVGGVSQVVTQRSNLYSNQAILNRDLPMIKAMNANTIRTYGDLPDELLNHPSLQDQPREMGLKVIAGFEIPYNLDFVDRDPKKGYNRNLQYLVDEFRTFVRKYKDSPAILAWAIGNENNAHLCEYPLSPSEYCYRDQQLRGFYNLVNEMAEQARLEERNPFVHPTILISAEIDDIGSKPNKDHQVLSNIDIHGINSYRGFDFGNIYDGNILFDHYQKRSRKPILVTEFGTDACFYLPDGPNKCNERVDLQLAGIASAWDDLMFHAVEYPIMGGVIYQWADSWWKTSANNVWKKPTQNHDATPSIKILPNGAYVTGGQPDGYINSEWFGINGLRLNPDGSVCETPAGTDCLERRPVYEVLKNVWADPRFPETKYSISGQTRMRYLPSVALVPFTTVRLQGKDIHGEKIERFVTSDFEGSYIFTDVLPGRYQVKAFRFGWNFLSYRIRITDQNIDRLWVYGY